MRRNAEETNFDSITVEKLSSGGYRIMNGHHRWLAAKMLRVNKVPIQIVNPIHIEDIIAMIEKLNEDMAVFFDLDEVLFCDEDAENVDKLSYPLNRIFKERLRLGTAILIPELRREGFEVWVYTTSFRSELYIRTLFRFYGIRFDGIVNGQRHQKEVQGDRRDPMPNKLPSFYHITLHIDDEAIVATYGKTYGFDVYQLDAQDDDWAEKIMDRVRTIKKNKF